MRENSSIDLPPKKLDSLAEGFWLNQRMWNPASTSRSGDRPYELTAEGAAAPEALGTGAQGTRALRRRFAFACLDWSEQTALISPGALGASLLSLALRKKWLPQDLDSPALRVTRIGHRSI